MTNQYNDANYHYVVSVRFPGSTQHVVGGFTTIAEAEERKREWVDAYETAIVDITRELTPEKWLERKMRIWKERHGT